MVLELTATYNAKSPRFGSRREILGERDFGDKHRAYKLAASV